MTRPNIKYSNHQLLIEIYNFFKTMTFQKYLELHDAGHKHYQNKRKPILFCYAVDSLKSKGFKIERILDNSENIREASIDKEDEYRDNLIETLRQRDNIQSNQYNKDCEQFYKSLDFSFCASMCQKKALVQQQCNM